MILVSQLKNTLKTFELCSWNGSIFVMFFYRNGPYRFIDLYAWSLRSGATKEGLRGVALLDELCHREWDLEFLKLKPSPVFLSSCCRSRCRTLSYIPAPRPPVCHHTSYHNNGLNLWTISQPQLKVFRYKSCHDHDLSS